MTTAYIGLGSNMGDRLTNLSAAVERIASLPETHVETVSHAYESVPAFVEDQPMFLNAVVDVTTGLEAPALLSYLNDIEAEMGRERDVPKGPRTIDLDILLFGDEEWDSETLVIPHPGLLERDFVVTPLLEVAPRVKLPNGTHPRRSSATVGEVMRDYGPVPDPGVPHNMPVDADEWVMVAETTSPADAIAGFEAGLQFKKQVLEQEGIPVAYEPWEPGAEIDPFGVQSYFRLVVPVEYGEQARALLEAVEAAPMQIPDQGTPAM